MGIPPAGARSRAHHERFRHVLIFKNHGAEAERACRFLSRSSQPRPLDLPPRAAGAARRERLLLAQRTRCIFCDIVDLKEAKTRCCVVFENDEFIAASPFERVSSCAVPKTHALHLQCTRGRTRLRQRDQGEPAPKRSLDDPPFNYIIHSAPLREAQSKHYHWNTQPAGSAPASISTRRPAGERGRGFARGARDDRRAAAPQAAKAS